MGVIYILVGFSLLAALLFLGAFFWAVKSGQYEDDYTPSIRMLFDDENLDKDSPILKTSNNTKKES
jgi:cbb3-type cytochrome oxidase maturation protein